MVFGLGLDHIVMGQCEGCSAVLLDILWNLVARYVPLLVPLVGGT